VGTYIDQIVKRFGLEESRGVKTPMEPGFVLTEEDFAEEPTESMISEMRSLIVSIGYCATAVRFDISHAVSVLQGAGRRRRTRCIGWTHDSGRKGDTIHRVSQQCEVATRISPGVRRWWSPDFDTEIHGETATAAGPHLKINRRGHGSRGLAHKPNP
jgi:hypothetical protein